MSLSILKGMATSSGKIISWLLLCSFANFARAAESTDNLATNKTGQGAVFGFLEENDLVVDTDRHYTQGIKFYYLNAEWNTPQWAQKLADDLPSGFTQEHTRFGYEVGQNIYTPANVSTTAYQPFDRPYGGWLYVGMILQRRGGTTRYQTPTLDSLTLDLGLIGPDSLADKAQTWVHQIRGFALPQGWANQLHNEPGLQLKYQRQWLYRGNPQNAWNVDLIPHVGVSLGNVLTSAHVGSMIRMGYHLPDDFGPQNIDSLSVDGGGRSEPHQHFGLYGYAGVEGRAVGWNEMLDGNLFSSSHSIAKYHAVGDAKLGVAAVFRNLDVAFSLVYRSPEFIGQTEHNAFGVFSMRVKF